MLQVKKISKQFSNTQVVFKDLAFELPSHAFVELIGDNGIGKTTLLRIISGLVNYEGDCIVNGTSMRTDYDLYMAQTAFLPNEPFIYDYLTINEMIELVSLNAKECDNNCVYELIDAFKLTRHMHTISKELSLGTRQKAAFILGFMNFPRIILMDEPFVNFDNNSYVVAVEFIKKYIKANDALVLFATHSLSHAPILIDAVTHSLVIENDHSCEIKFQSSVT